MPSFFGSSQTSSPSVEKYEYIFWYKQVEEMSGLIKIDKSVAILELQRSTVNLSQYENICESVTRVTVQWSEGLRFTLLRHRTSNCSLSSIISLWVCVNGYCFRWVTHWPVVPLIILFDICVCFFVYLITNACILETPSGDHSNCVFHPARPNITANGEINPERRREYWDKS